MNFVHYHTPKEIDEQYKRKGKCNGCGICCKIEASSDYNDRYFAYLRNFGWRRVKIDGKVILIRDVRCAQLTKNNKCRLHGKRSKPIPCVQFPLPDCGVYQYCAKQCGYHFDKSKKAITMSR